MDTLFHIEWKVGNSNAANLTKKPLTHKQAQNKLNKIERIARNMFSDGVTEIRRSAYRLEVVKGITVYAYNIYVA